MEKDLKNNTRSELSEIIASFKQKAYFADYLFAFIHQKHTADLNKISPIPKPFRAQLAETGYYISALSILKTQTDSDGTTKYLFGLPDGQCIETVRLVDEGRITLCLSTQVGCRMGCRFCATGRLQFQRNLTAAEIVDQIYQIEQAQGPVQNLVYMGMGEPLDNFNQVIRSLEILHDEQGRYFGMRHITLSTCGLTEPIRKLANLKIHPRLAVSIHAADDLLRSQLMPICRKEPLERLMQTLVYYQQRTGRRITIEYCMIDGLNDTPELAGRLALLLSGLKTNVNLIELNDYSGCPYRPSPGSRIKNFAARLKEAGIDTAIRFKRGRSINAACGQLGAEWLSTAKIQEPA
ncbi:MAG TPA: 23S rRNA (adenine(2503)-C(2))-methyltransferase RlmN [Anaerohalosphaeraceae bacterium]|nr:23S rRNA (adenine(2503)-C(2))-methyltransferase RlmN [Anaerohalosphaeraceae bacterium]